MSDVASCPWCPKSPIVFEIDGLWFVACVYEECPVQPDLADGFKTEAQAIEVWGTRPEPA